MNWKSASVVAALAAFSHPALAGPIKFSLHYGDAAFAALNGANVGDPCNPSAALAIPPVGQNFTVQVWVENLTGSIINWTSVGVFLGFDMATTNNSTVGYGVGQGGALTAWAAGMNQQIRPAADPSNVNLAVALVGGGTAGLTQLANWKYRGAHQASVSTLRSIGGYGAFLGPTAAVFELPAQSAIRIFNQTYSNTGVASGSYFGDAANENGMTLNSYVGANSGACLLVTASGAIYPRDGRDFDPNDTTVRYALRSGPKIVFVSPCGDDTAGNGFSWQTAFATIQKATTAGLAPGDEIWVERGTYFGPITVPSGVKLIGGWYGNEAFPNQRVPRRWPTILDGNFSVRPVTLQGGSASDRTTVTDFIIQHGKGIPAGVLASANSVVRIEDCVLRDNTAIGGTFTQGGGIGLQSGVNSEIFANYFDTNWSQANVGATSVGGAISTQAGTHKIYNNVFFNNRCVGPGTVADGGAIRLGAGASGGAVYIINNTFLNNIASVGGAISIPSNSNPSVVLENNIYQNNSSGVYAAAAVTGAVSQFSVDYMTGVPYTGPITQASNVTGNPYLGNTSSGDVHLCSGSAAYFNGSTSNLFTATDYEGETRMFPSTPFVDPGADEAPILSSFPHLSLLGQVSMNHYVGELRGLPITVTVGGNTFTRNLDHRGHFFITTNLLGPGTYTVTAKMDNTLSQTITNVVVSPNGGGGVSFGFCPGDVDGDDVVSIFDYILLSDAFDTNRCSPGWNEMADLDGDGVISIFDYILLSENFDKSGPC